MFVMKKSCIGFVFNYMCIGFDWSLVFGKELWDFYIIEYLIRSLFIIDGFFVLDKLFFLVRILENIC